MRRLAIGMLEGPPMIAGPGLGDRGFVDGLLKFSLAHHRNGEPTGPLRRFDLVAVVPVALGVLDIVKNDVFVNPINEIKESAPWNVGRLNDGDAFLFTHGL